MPMKKVICTHPWTHMSIMSNGKVRTCCEAWTKVIIGNIKNQSIKEIWNGQAIQEIRKRILNNEWQKVCYQSCPYIIKYKKNKMDPDDLDNKELSQDIKNNKITTDIFPEAYCLANWSLCNLKCIMCYNSCRKEAEKKPDHTKKMLKDIISHIDDCRLLILCGNGDPFVRTDSMELMTEYEWKKINPKLSFWITTNGNLFNQKNWNKIKHNNFKGVNISIDAATKKTYEKIRVGGNWDVLMRNLKFIKSLREAGKIENMHINFCVMRGNYKEMLLFVELGKKLKVDRIIFTKIRGEHGKENIFELKDETCLKKIKNIINNIYIEDKSKILDITGFSEMIIKI